MATPSGEINYSVLIQKPPWGAFLTEDAPKADFFDKLNGAPCGTPFFPASHDYYAVKFTQRIGLGEVCGIISVKVEDCVIIIVWTIIGFVQIKSCISPFGIYLCLGSAVYSCGVCLTWMG